MRWPLNSHKRLAGVSPLSQKTPGRQRSFSSAFPWLSKEDMRFLFSTTPWSQSKLPLQPYVCVSSLVFLLAALCWWALKNNNTYDDIYDAVIMAQSHCESSPGSLDECRLRWLPTLRPRQTTWVVSPPVGCYHPHPPSPMLLLLSP